MMVRSTRRPFFRENRWFWISFLVFCLFALLIVWCFAQGAVVWFFNAHRSPAGDLFFRYFTTIGEETGYLLAIAFFLFYRFRSALMIPLIGLGVTVVTYVLKKTFRHPRPLAYFRELDLDEQLRFVEGVTVHSGANSFPSGHTMAAFALFSFIAFSVHRKQWTALWLLLAAVLVGLSRVYLVQHFLKDVLLGGAVGVLVGWGFYALQYRLGKKAWLDKRIKIRKDSRV